MYINKLDDIGNRYNNKYSRIKMKPVDGRSSSYIDFIKGNNEEGPKFKIGDIVRILKYKNIFVKCYIHSKLF